MSKIIDCSREVTLNEFQDCLGCFMVEWVTELINCYEDYKKEIAEVENVYTIADLVKCYESVRGVEFTDVISVIIYKNGSFRYIACY